MISDLALNVDNYRYASGMQPGGRLRLQLESSQGPFLNKSHPLSDSDVNVANLGRIGWIGDFSSGAKTL